MMCPSMAINKQSTHIKPVSHFICHVLPIISYLGVKSWDLQVCDRASTITPVDREKKNSAYDNNKKRYFFLG